MGINWAYMFGYRCLIELIVEGNTPQNLGVG